jgi:serine phosphatase RsbU (regulator of sigma subunit)
MTIILQKLKLSIRHLRIIYTGITAYTALASAYFLFNGLDVLYFSNDQCLWNYEIINDNRVIVIRNILTGGVSDRAGLKDGDILVAFNDITLYSTAQAQLILNQHEPGDSIVYKVIREGRALNLPIYIVKTYNPLSIAINILGFSFLIIGFIVGLSRPQERIPALFFITSMSGSLMFMSGANGTVTDNVLNNLFYFINNVIGFTFFAPTFFHFFSSFPYETFKPGLKKILLIIVYGSFIIFTFIIILFAILNAGFPNGGNILLFIMMGLSLTFFFRSYFSIKDMHERRPLRSVLIGVATGMSGFIYLLIINLIYPIAVINHPELLIPVISIAFISLSFGYSIIRHRLMDIQIIIKKSLVYAATTTSLGIIYILALFFFGLVMSRWTGIDKENPVFQFALLLALALIFIPVKNRIQDFVDRRFYRERYNYQKALRTFSQELPYLTQLDKILENVLGTITRAMHIDKMAIALYNSNETMPARFIQTQPMNMICNILNQPHGLVDYLTGIKNPVFLYPVNLKEMDIPEPEKQTIIHCNIVLALPVINQGRLTGVFFIGPKISEKPFSDDDIDLLVTLANQTGLAIENARLLKEEIEKIKMTNELNLAKKIQESLLPQESPFIPGLDVAGISIPALSVGGDYFDYIKLDPQRLLVCIGDVSGKGISAALYISKIQGMIQIASQLYSSPKNILTEINSWMYRSMDRQSFVTIVLGLIDLKNNTITICRAGHNPVVDIQSGRLNLIQCKGIGIGLTESEFFTQHLEEYTKSLDKGHRLVFYTDGVTEAMNEKYEEYGEERFYRIIQNSSGGSRQLIDELISDLKQFCGSAEPHDDITMVVAGLTR